MKWHARSLAVPRCHRNNRRAATSTLRHLAHVPLKWPWRALARTASCSVPTAQSSILRECCNHLPKRGLTPRRGSASDFATRNTYSVEPRVGCSLPRRGAQDLRNVFQVDPHLGGIFLDSSTIHGDRLLRVRAFANLHHSTGTVTDGVAQPGRKAVCRPAPPATTMVISLGRRTSGTISFSSSRLTQRGQKLRFTSRP